MLQHRVIPCLLLQNEGLVKTTKFSKSKYVGDPINAIRIFNDKEVDEIIVLDINASKNKSEPDYKLIEQFASECFMPLCYGGGVENIQQARRLFDIGIEKICIQTAALNNIDIINDISQIYGSQSVVASVDVKKNIFGKYKLYSSQSRKLLKRNWLTYMNDLVEAGSGEIMINSVDKDGTLKGMNTKLIRLACDSVPVPVIAGGGVGSLEDIKLGILAGASAIAVGSFFVFHGPHQAVLITYPKYTKLTKLLNN